MRATTTDLYSPRIGGHLIGPTGTGKSTTLAQWIVADAAAGHSVLVIEPKGDLVRQVLARLPEARHQDVVVIEPGQTDQVVGFNPLAGPPADAERRADELLGLLRTVFGSAIGPRSSDVLLHALITAARADDGTLTDVPALLTNPGFRRRVVGQVSDPLVLAPFWGWFDGLSEPERRQVTAPVMNKLRVLTTRAPIRRLLGQPHPAFQLDQLFIHPRIMLVNLNRGVLGPETARLLGSLLLSQLWQAVQRRATQPESERRPVMVVLDEWQDYVGALDFGDVLAQARGLGVGLSLAHQHLAQLSPNLRAAVLANARSQLCFRPAAGDAKALAGVLDPDVTPESLERLGAYQAAARVQRDGRISRAFAVATLPLPAPAHDPQKLVAASAARWGVDGAEVDRALLARWQDSGPGPGEGAIGIVRRTRS